MKARQLFRRLCRGKQDTFKRRGRIGNILTQQLQGKDIGKEEDMRMVKNNAGQAHEKALKEYDKLIGAWDIAR